MAAEPLAPKNSPSMSSCMVVTLALWAVVLTQDAWLANQQDHDANGGTGKKTYGKHH